MDKKIDTLRLNNLRNHMVETGVDALICRLPENIVYLSDYWPHHGFSVAVQPKDSKAILFVPEVEIEYVDSDWVDLQAFGWGLLKDMDSHQSYRSLLTDVRDMLGLRKGRIGVERGFEIVGPCYRTAEHIQPEIRWWNLLDEVFDSAHLVDNKDLLQTTRATKTEYELAKLSLANEIAEIGVAEFHSQLQPGISETDIGALIEYKIRASGPGHKGARLVRATAEVGAGPLGSTKSTLFVPSTIRKIEAGDIVLVELGVVVDGYWADQTHVAVVGYPNQRQKDIYNKVLEAQQAAASEMRPGISFSSPDAKAREILSKAGLGQYFIHNTGHGIGLRYHEAIPVLKPGAIGELRIGMVSTVEPGVYIPGFGGVRIEDSVAVGQDGPIFLSSPRRPWE